MGHNTNKIKNRLVSLISVAQTNNTIGATLVQEVHGTITQMEELCESRDYLGDVDRLFALIESCACARPVSYNHGSVSLVRTLHFAK